MIMSIGIMERNQDHSCVCPSQPAEVTTRVNGSICLLMPPFKQQDKWRQCVFGGLAREVDEACVCWLRATGLRSGWTETYGGENIQARLLYLLDSLPVGPIFPLLKAMNYQEPATAPRQEFNSNCPKNFLWPLSALISFASIACRSMVDLEEPSSDGDSFQRIPLKSIPGFLECII